MDKLEKQILKNQLEIMSFLSGFRTMVSNIEIDGIEVELSHDESARAFTKCRAETEKLLK